jgi:hypothetical protein
MSMNADVLGQAIADVLVDDDATTESIAQVENLWKQIAGVIISHIQANAVVSVNTSVSVTSVSGVTTGGGVSGPGSGSGSGTGTIA